jgi:hypothetical protein
MRSKRSSSHRDREEVASHTTSGDRLVDGEAVQPVLTAWPDDGLLCGHPARCHTDTTQSAAADCQTLHGGRDAGVGDTAESDRFCTLKCCQDGQDTERERSEIAEIPLHAQIFCTDSTEDSTYYSRRG